MRIVANLNRPEDAIPHREHLIFPTFPIKVTVLCFLIPILLLNPQRLNVTLITFQGCNTSEASQREIWKRGGSGRRGWNGQRFDGQTRYLTQCLVRFRVGLRKSGTTPGSGEAVLAEVEQVWFVSSALLNAERLCQENIDKLNNQVAQTHTVKIRHPRRSILA